MKVLALRPDAMDRGPAGDDRFLHRYSRVLVRRGNDDWGWATLAIDDVELMIARPNEHTRYEKIGFTGSFYFTTDDVDAMWAKVKDKASVCYGIENFEYGMREFAVYANNGYLLQFGREIEN